MFSDRTDILAARVNAVQTQQANLHGAMRSEDGVDLLRNRVRAAEDLLSQLQGRLSATEEALGNVRMEAEALAAEQAAQMAATQVSPGPILYNLRTRPAHLCAYSAQSQATTTAQTRKRKRSEDGVEGDEDGNNVTDSEDEEDKQYYSVRAPLGLGEHAAQKSRQGSEPAELHALQCTRQRLLSLAL